MRSYRENISRKGKDHEVSKTMKYLRYIILALLAYLLVFSVRYYVFPAVTLLSGAAYEGHDLPEVVARSRTTMLPMLALISLLFIGWLFPAKKIIVLGVVVICLPIFAYLAYSSLSALGFTPRRSLLAITQGYGTSRVGWLLFLPHSLDCASLC